MVHHRFLLPIAATILTTLIFDLHAEDWVSDPSVRPLTRFAKCGGECLTQNYCQEPQLHWSFTLPAWLPEMHGSTTVRGRTAPVDITTRDVFRSIDDLDFIVGGKLEVEYGRLGAFADGLYYNLSVDQNILRRIDLSAGFAQAIVDFAVTYDVIEGLNLLNTPTLWEAEVLVGGRYNLLQVDRITITGPRGRSVTRSGDRDWVDPIIGGIVRAPLRSDLELSLRGDVGGFGIGSASDFTWNIEALAEFECSECCRLMLGYRLLDIDQEQGSGDGRFAYDIQIRGPIARIGFEY